MLLEKKNFIIIFQTLLNEKDLGHQKLNSVIESGEKLYPDTAGAGREKIRGELRMANQDWENFSSNLNDTFHQMDSYLSQWSSYIDGHDHLLKWMAETGALLKADTELKNTLQEKKQKLQTLRVSFI